MIFISSPFSSPLVGVQEERYNRVMEFTAHCLSAGYQVFSPIVYTVPMAMTYKMPGDAAHWEQFNIEFLRHCEAMFVLRLTGWDQSKGVQLELRVAKLMRIPTVHYNERFEEVLQQVGGEELKVRK